MWYKVFKKVPQAHYMLEMAEKETGQLLLVSDMSCGSQILVKSLFKSWWEPAPFLSI